ncbi:T7SS effector LXG polymorphic toxin [Streptococcus suis]
MVKMNLPSSDNQATSIGRVSASRVGAYESAMQALGSFIGAEGLSGQAYDNAKDYAASTLLPLLKAAILYEESLSEAVKRLPSDYRATEYLEGKSLDSEDLEAELARLESVGMRLERSIDHALAMASDYPDYEWHAHSMMRQLNQVIDRKNKVRRQLQALYAFNERSSSFFSGIGDLETQLSQGIAQVGSDMSNFSGSFPSGLSPVWVSAVNQKWNDRVKRMRDTSSPADFRKLEEREADALDLNADIKNIAEKNGMTVEEFLAAAQNGALYAEAGLVGVKYANGKAFINGKKLTIDELGRVKLGSRFLYNSKTGHLYRFGKDFQNASGIDLLEQPYVRASTGVINFENIRKTGAQGFKDAINPLNDFKGWKGATNLTKAGKLLGIVGTGLTIIDAGFSNFTADNGFVNGTNWANFSVDVGVEVTASAVSSAGGAMVGATVGSFVLPPLGTVAGFVFGVAVSAALDWDIFGGKSVKDHTKDLIKGVYQ